MLKLRNFVLQVAAVLAVALPATAQSYKVTNILSDGSVPATATDANFLNPWAISASGTFWISTPNSGFNYVVAPATATPSFKVIVPTAAAPNTAPGLPSGSVTTGGAVGMVLSNQTKASFLFSTLDGTISGWNSKLGTNNAISLITNNNSGAGAAYTGLAILNIATNGVTSKSYILAPNFGTANKVEVYDSNFAASSLPGNFTDPNLPTGYSPYAIHVIGTQVFVTYALRTAAAPYRTVNGVGNGIVDVFDNTGTLVSRVATAGNLNSPWGVAIAPANFGVFSNDLLIGNFGDGLINVYDPKTFAYLGQLMDSTGKSLSYPSLWELLPGGTTVTGTAAVSGGDTSTVYFTAGLANEQHGLLAGIAANPTASGTATFAFTGADGSASVTAGSSATTHISAVPVNGFSGTVTLACSGLPTGATCSFSPATLSVATATGPSVATVTIQTTKATSALVPFGLPTNIVAACLMPLAAFMGLHRKHAAMRIFGFAVFMLATATLITGCSSNSTNPTTTTSTPATPFTPAGTSNISITATAGSITQTSTIALTVK